MSTSAEGRRSGRTIQLRRLPPRHLSLPTRLLGLGSVFGKTLRDSRWSVAGVAAVLAVLMLGGGAAMSGTYGTAQTRLELRLLSENLPPVMRGFYGNPVAVDTLGGFLSWHYGTYVAMIIGLWSLLALSATLAGEARRGSLDLVVATTQSRRVIALSKVAAHLVALAAVAVLLALFAWLTGVIFEKFEGDAIAGTDALAFAAGAAIRGLVAGSIAFALASFVGRGAAAGIGGAAMLAGYVVTGYRGVVPVFDTIAPLTWWSWTADHLPLAGVTAWPQVALTAAVCGMLLLVGVEAFARRDIGGATLPMPHLPGWLAGVHGPVTRSFGELLPAAAWWGIGLGAYGLLMAASSRALTDAIGASPGLIDAIRAFLPTVDLTTVAGFLQLAFLEIGFVLAGIEATHLVGARWSDERSGRLELQLATPLTRARWLIGSTVAVWLGIAFSVALLAMTVALGVAAAGQEPLGPATGTLVLAMYGAALAGIGSAIGGVFGPRLAAPTVLIVTFATFLVDLLAEPLKLPPWVEQLALSSHFGSSMIGQWDAAGILLSAGIGLLGVLVGAWGIMRRDIAA